MVVVNAVDNLKKLGLGGNIAINSVSNAESVFNSINTNYENYVEGKNAIDYENSNVYLEDSVLLKELEKFINDTDGIKNDVSAIHREWPDEYKNTKSDLNKLFVMISRGVWSFNEYKTLIETKSKEVFEELSDKFLDLQSSYNSSKSSLSSILADAKYAETQYNHYCDLCAKETSETYTVNDGNRDHQKTILDGKLNSLKQQLPGFQKNVIDMIEILGKGLKKI